jgi:hypothetical protein
MLSGPYSKSMDAKDAFLGLSKAAPASRELKIVTTGLWGICAQSKKIPIIALLLGAFLTTPVFAQISEPVGQRVLAGHRPARLSRQIRLRAASEILVPIS